MSSASGARAHKRLSQDRNIRNHETEPHPAKRHRRKRSLDAFDSASISLPLDALGLVMEFLSPRQLYNLSFCCKTLRGFITTKIVVRSALIHGGHAKKTMTELYELMSTRAIHVPSPLRLLRLVNGKRCEFCCSKAVHHVRAKLGVFSCGTCTSADLTKPWRYSWMRLQENRERYSKIFCHPQVVSNPYVAGTYVWTKHKRVSGEMIGPLASFEDIDQASEYTSQVNQTIDSYIQNTLLTPSDTEEAYNEFNSTYEETLERAEMAAKERAEKKEANKRKAVESKLAKIEQMVLDLKEIVDQPYRELILVNREIFHGSGTNGISKRPMVRFEVPFVDNLLKQFVITPSKFRKKDLTNIANSINTNLSLLAQSSFAALEFLSRHPLDVELKAHFGSKFTDLESLFNMPVRTGRDRRCLAKAMINERFFDLLKKGELISALAHLVRKDFSCLFPAQSTAETTLASTIWFHSLKGKGDEDDLFRAAYDTTASLLPKAKGGLEGYIEWMESAFRRDGNRDERRAFALEKACSDAALLPLLMAESYRELDKKISKGYGSKSWHKYC